MGEEALVLESVHNRVGTLTMNRPKQLNGWTGPMMIALKGALQRLGQDDSIKAAVLTGKDPYYCAGVNLSASIRPMHPAKLHAFIVENNAAVFNSFIDFPKPILVAANGPAIGACVTSATLCDAIVASEKATFSTPFARLGIVPEGCSSVHFEKIMGKANAERMLGPEGWAPTAKEALEAGLVSEVVPHDDLMARAQAVAEKWVQDGKNRSLVEQGLVGTYKQVNHDESVALADAFLAPPFLESQRQFLNSKGKTRLANMFWFIKVSRPLWSKMLKK